MKPDQDVYRIGDVAVFGEPPQEPVPDPSPLIAVEILSKDDRHSDLLQKREGHLAGGISDLGGVDPITQRFSGYGRRGRVSSGSLPDSSFQLTPSDLFSDL
jgi:hypothetical protein